MQKYAKHFLATISGSGFMVAGALLWQVVIAGFDWSRISKYGLGDQISHCGTWPFAIIGSILLGLGVLMIVVAFFNLLTRE